MAEMETQGDWHWRNSMKPPRFFALDARVGLFALFFILHMRAWTLGLFVAMCVVFWMLERKGLSFETALRSVRTWLLGTKRPGWLWIRKRKYHDYG